MKNPKFCLDATKQNVCGVLNSSTQPASTPAPSGNSMSGMCVTWRACVSQVVTSWGNPWRAACQWLAGGAHERNEIARRTRLLVRMISLVVRSKKALR
jgi:hypothetical protein